MNKRNLLVAALLISAALNLLILGAIAGRWSRQEAPPPPPPLAWTTQAQAPETQREVRRRMQSRAKEVAPIRAGMRKAVAEVRRAAVAEPYDAAALKSALAQLRIAQESYQELMHDSVADSAAGLSREQRLALLRKALDRNAGRNGTPARRVPPQKPGSR